MLRANPFVETTYVICPETTIAIGVLDDNNNVVDGDLPIYPRSQSIIKCGDDGKSINNCVF